MRPGPAIQAALFVERPRLPFRRRRRRDDCTSPAALAASAVFAGTSCKSAIRRIAIPQPMRGQRPNRLIEPAVEEAAVPGQPARARAHFRFPLAIHSRELPAPTGVTAIIVRQALRVPTFSMNPLWGTTLRIAIEKHYRSVNKLWTMRLPCGRLRKMWKESFSREF